MKCINVKCEGKPAYDIVIESGFGGLSEAFNKLEITGRKIIWKITQIALNVIQKTLMKMEAYSYVQSALMNGQKNLKQLQKKKML